MEARLSVDAMEMLHAFMYTRAAKLRTSRVARGASVAARGHDYRYHRAGCDHTKWPLGPSCASPPL